MGSAFGGSTFAEAGFGTSSVASAFGLAAALADDRFADVRCVLALAGRFDFVAVLRAVIVDHSFFAAMQHSGSAPHRQPIIVHCTKDNRRFHRSFRRKNDHIMLQMRYRCLT